MTMASVKTIDSQRWICRIHLFQFNGTSSSILILLSRPTRLLTPELPGVLRAELLPGIDPRRVGPGEPSDGISAEHAIEHVKRDVPAGCAPRDESAIDAVPERQARAAAARLELPSDVAVLEEAGRLGARHSGFHRNSRVCPLEPDRRASRCQARIRVEGSPLVQVLRFG